MDRPSTTCTSLNTHAWVDCLSVRLACRTIANDLLELRDLDTLSTWREQESWQLARTVQQRFKQLQVRAAVVTTCNHNTL